MDTTYFQFLNKNVTGLHLMLSGGFLLLLTAIKYYTSGGVCKARKDLTGKTAIITGGNTGIGRQTVLDLALNNCNIIIGARDKARLEEVIKDIKKINPKIQASYAMLDLGDRQSIQQFSRFVQNNCSKIDFLINNAGIMMVPERRQTKDGLQMQMGINHFGHFYLTYLLFPLLKKSQNFRIINVSSKLHHRAENGLDFSDIQNKNNYNDLKVYSESKLANIYFTKELQARISNAKLNGSVYSLHPGVVRTELSRYMKSYVKLLMKFISPFWYLFTKSAVQGAQTTLHLVYSDQQKLIKGEYHADCQMIKSSPISYDQTARQKLWAVSQQAWNIKFTI